MADNPNLTEYGNGWEDGYQEGYQAAVEVFKDKFFGGPTKDMVLGWWAEHERESVDTDG